MGPLTPEILDPITEGATEAFAMVRTGETARYDNLPLKQGITRVE